MEAVVTQEYGGDQDSPGVWRNCCWKPGSTYTDSITRAAGNLMGKSALLNLAVTGLFSCTELLFY